MQIHEQTQRFILLLIFYLFGPILTLSIVGGIVVRKLPFQARSWERHFTQQTGLHWAIRSIEHCSPNFIRLHDVQILDDTAQRAVFNAQTIDVRLITETRREKVFPGIISTDAGKPAGLTGLLAGILPAWDSKNQFWQVTVPDSYLDFGKYSSEESALLVQNMLRKIFARFATLSEVPVQLAFEEIAVVSKYSLEKQGNTIEDKVDIFRFVQGNLYRTPTEIRSDWAFHIKDVSDFDRVHLSFALSSAETLDINFQTGRQPIPCGLAAVFCEPFKPFAGGSFLGTFSLSTRSGNTIPTIQLSDVVFKAVPLAPLVSAYTDFDVEGTVDELNLKRAVFGAEGISAEGHLLVVNGAVDSALVNRCVDNFRLTVERVTVDNTRSTAQRETMADLPEQMFPFTACAICFRLQPKEIDFWADRKWYDILMHYREAPLSSSAVIVRFPTHRRPVTYHELMSIFAADGAPVVPLTQGLQSLIPVLPIR